MKTAQTSDTQKLIPAHELIKRAIERGFNFGKANPLNRLRYYSAVGRIPHAVRKQAFKGGNKIIGFYPESTVEQLLRVQELKEKGLSAAAILDELVEKKIVEQEVVFEQIESLPDATRPILAAKERQTAGVNYQLNTKSANNEKAYPDALKSFVEREDLLVQESRKGIVFTRRWQFAYLWATPLLLIFVLIGLYMSPWRTEIEDQISDKVSSHIIAMIKGLDDRFAFSGQPVLGDKTTNLSLNQVGESNYNRGTAYTTANILQNPGFEAGPAAQETLKGYQPKGWQYWGISTSSDTFVSGYSVRSGTLGLFFDGLNGDYVNKELGIYQDQTKTVNGRDYALSVWVRVTGTAKVRLGFFGEADRRDPNYSLMSSAQWNSYGKDVSKTFQVSADGRSNSDGVIKEGDWNLVSFNYSKAALGKIPYIAISGISGERAFIDDVSLVEVAPAEIARNDSSKDRVISSLSITRIGNSSVLVDDSGRLYPFGGDLGSGSLGTVEHAFGALYLAKTSVDAEGNLTTAGNGIVNGDLSVGQNVTIANNLTIGGSFNFTNASTSGNFGIGKDASVAGKINLDSVTSQINATNNRPIQLGFMNTGRVELLSSSNYIDLSGNLDITGTYKVNGTSGVTAGTNTCVTTTGGIVTGTGSCPGGGGSGSSQWQLNNGVISPADVTQSVAVGGTATASAKFLVYGVSTTNPVASISGSSSQAALVIDNTVGDLLTASFSGLSRFVVTNSGNIGVGTTVPEFKLDLNGDGGIIARGTFASGASLTTAGAGTRLLWYPQKAAFRAGTVDGSEWNDANIGNYSTAFGYSNTSGGTASFTVGQSNSASNTNAVAVGYLNTASGQNSFAGGYRTTASNDETFAFGDYLTASATLSHVFGSGIDNSSRLVNNISNSFMVGYLSNIPTLYVGPANSSVGSVGTVGIGTSNPLATFHVQNLNNNTQVASVSAANGLAALLVDNTVGDLFTASSSGLSRFVISQSGNVGIGTRNPTVALDVTGAAHITGTLTLDTPLTVGNGGTGTASTPTNGQLLIGNGTNYTLGTLTSGTGISVTNASGAITVTNTGATSITGTVNQITASSGTGDITLSIPSDFRAPGTVNAVTGIYTGAEAGTQRIDASGNLVNIGSITATGTFTNTGNATISGTLGVGKGASIAGKLNLDSATSQINATNNRSLDLGFANTGRVQFLSSSNYIDANNNLDIAGVYKNGGTSGVTVVSFSCVTSVGGIVTGSGTCPGGNGSGDNNWVIDGTNGVITPVDPRQSLALGSNSTASAFLHFDGTTGFITNPGATRGLNNIPGAVGLDDILAVAATSAAYPALSIEAKTGQAAVIVNQADTGGDIFAASSAGTNKFVINKTGNVGIGSSAPGTTLDVTGTGRFSSTLTASNSLTVSGGTLTVDAAATLDVNSTAQINGITLDNDADITGADQIIGFNDLRLYGDSTGGPDVYIAAGGNVGIGTTNPGSLLSVGATSQFTVNSSGNINTSGTLTVDSTSTLTGLATLTAGFDANAASTVTRLTIDGNSGTALTVSGTSFTTDISLQNGETIDNDTDNQINLNLGTTGTLKLTNGSNLTSDQTTFNLLNATVTTLNIGGVATTAFGGGYGSTGVSISSGGNIQANGTLTVDSTSTLTGLATLTAGFDSNAASTVNSLTLDANTGTALTVSGTSFTTDISLQNGETIDNDTNNQINLNLGTTGTLKLTNGSNLTSDQTTFNLLNATVTTLNIGGVATTAFGGGYGSTGVSISSGGNIQANGALTVDSTSTLWGNVGIQTSTVGNALDVEGNISVEGRHGYGIEFYGNGDSNHKIYYSGITNSLHIDSFGTIYSNKDWNTNGLAASGDITTTTNISATGNITGFELRPSGGAAWGIAQSLNAICAGANAGLCFEKNVTTTPVSEMYLSGGGALVLRSTLTQSGSPDVAENINVTDLSIEAGDILVAENFDQNNSDIYYKALGTKSHSANASNIIGIVSSDPGILLSSRQIDTGDRSDANQRPLAVAGRVPLKVSSINGSIKAGDPITTSVLPGVGMKATQPGRIVATALEDYEASDSAQVGKIIALVNLSWYEPTMANMSIDVSIAMAEIPQIKSEIAEVRAETASISGRLANLEQTVASSSSLVSNQIVINQNYLEVATLSAQTARLSENLIVIGQTQLANTSVGGTLNVGLLRFDDLTADISTLTGDLGFQGGKVKVTKDGDLEVNTGVIAGNEAMRGSLTLISGQTATISAQNWSRPPKSIVLTPGYKTSVWVENISNNGFKAVVDTAPNIQQQIYWMAIW